MNERPSTLCGKMLAALARRDERDFAYWREQVDASDADRSDLWPTLYEVFQQAVRRRLTSNGQHGIREFLSRSRVPLWSGATLPAHEADLLIRSALGERGLVSGIDNKVITLVRMQLYVYAIDDLGLNSDAVDSLIATAERYVAGDKSPE